MIKFRQKNFSEYDAMRSLYVELMKYSDKYKFRIIDTSALIPILKGNNVVIERFVISTSLFGKDKYRMYLKVGAKAKMPDEVRLPERVYDKKLANARLNFNGGLFGKDNNNGGGDKKKETHHSDTTLGETRIKLFGGGGNNRHGISAEISPNVDISYQVSELIGEAIKYDKPGRSLVLEFSSIRDAIYALNILPFGLNYQIYLLNA